jgi:hypothetical protein
LPWLDRWSFRVGFLMASLGLGVWLFHHAYAGRSLTETVAGLAVSVIRTCHRHIPYGLSVGDATAVLGLLLVLPSLVLRIVKRMQAAGSTKTQKDI